VPLSTWLILKQIELPVWGRIDEFRVLIEEFIVKWLSDGDMWSKQRLRNTGLE